MRVVARVRARQVVAVAVLGCHGGFAMAIVLVPGDTSLALDRDARSLVLRVELHVLRIFIGDGCERFVHVELGVRVGLDPFDDAFQVAPALRHPQG